MYTPTITYHELKEGDLLFYRGSSWFSFFIRIGEVIKSGQWRHFFIAFTHVAQVVYNREIDCLQRYDSMEWLRTWFRDIFGQAYVFRFKEPLTQHELIVWRQYLLARKWSAYDLKWALSTMGREQDDIFGDYCSELTNNALYVGGRNSDDRAKTPYWLYVGMRDKLEFVWVIL